MPPSSRIPEYDDQRNPCRLEEDLCSPSRTLELSELARGVRAAVSALADRQRAALEMYQFQNRTYAEIAAALALTTKATKSLLYRAQLQLKGFLNGMQEISCLLQKREQDL